MKNNESLNKFANNKKILFIAPHLIYISSFLSMYILNQEIIFFQTLLILLLILFTITTIIYIIVNKILKNDQYTFYILSPTSLLYELVIKVGIIWIDK